MCLIMNYSFFSLTMINLFFHLTKYIISKSLEKILDFQTITLKQLDKKKVIIYYF